MAVKPNPDLLLAKTLAAPFSQGNPLSYKEFSDGSMVVIAADGRKLWFDPDEVASTRAKLKGQVKK